MEWFNGDVGAAISLSKQKNAVFVVFVYGVDENSRSALQAINSPEVSQILSSNDFVAIRLESGTEPYHQFAQIYQVVPVPSLFFIGQNGIPLDIMAGEITGSGLLDHINKVKSSISGPTAQINSPTNMVSASSSADVPSETEKKSVPTTSNQDQGVTESLEERIQRAEKARLALAAKKQKEEEQREKEREIARRREGQELAKAQKSRESIEAQQALEERRKEREMEREAREKVLQQIARDKAERAAKFAGEKKASNNPTVSTPPSAAPAPVTSARLQFRLPDGSSHTNIFTPEALLGEVRQYVKTTLHPGSFTLSMAFPRAELASTDDNRSLQDMGLVPSAALLILPGPSTANVVASSSAGVMGFIWLLLSPFSFIWSFVSSRVWGTTEDNRPPTSQPERGTSAAAAAAQARANQSDVRQRVRREGNIHRLAGMQDPDDENNTYNGNSTQQM